MTLFVYDAGGALAAEYSTIVAPPQEAKTSYLTTDHLGSPRVITDENGEVIARRDFLPFGEELFSGVGPRTETLKYGGAQIDNIRQRFTGYEKDWETQLDFAEARMYQNKHGRFTAPDPLLASASAVNPQTFNRYIYTGNNPINYTDPSGLIWCGQGGSGNGLADIAWHKGDKCQDGWNPINLNASYTCNQGPCTIGGTNYAAGTVFRFNSDGTHRAALGDPGPQPVSQGQAVSGATGNIAGENAADAAASGASSGSPDGTAHSARGNSRDLIGLCFQTSCEDPGPVRTRLVEGADAHEVLELVQTAADATAMTEIPILSQAAGATSFVIDVVKGDKIGAGMSLGGLLPIGGNVLDAAKPLRRAAMKAVAKTVNGNSKLSQKAQHGYEVFEKATGNVVKTGVSSGPITKSGKSYRANSQVSKWNKSNPGAYDSRIVKTVPAGPGARAKILAWEKKNARKLRKKGHLSDDFFHQRP